MHQGVDDTADQAAAHGNGNDTAGALDDVAFLDAGVAAQDNDGDGLFVQVLSHAVFAVGELHQLVGHALGQAGNGGDAVTGDDDDAGLAGLELILVVLDLTTDDFCDLFGS